MEPLTAKDPRIIGEFRLRARLGAGGMGHVFLGFSMAGRAAAVKVIRPELARDQAFLSRFRNEVAAARAVTAIYTAPVLAAGPDDRPPWLASAFVPGPALDTVIRTHGPLPEPALWRLAAGLAEALLAIHSCGVVHRDLKPANVLLAEDGPRVIDFGISKAANGATTTSAGLIGTPGFMSPEQAEGRSVGPPSDLFSLGCVLCYAAAGQPPFGADNAVAMLYRVVHAQPDLQAVPARMREIIAGCMAKEPEARPPLPVVTEAIISGIPAEATAAASFWPASVGGIIRAYQASLDASIPAEPAPVLTQSSYPPVPAAYADRTGTSYPPPAYAGRNAAPLTQTSYPAVPAGHTGPAAPAGRTGPTAPSARNPTRRRALALVATGAAAAVGVTSWRVAAGASGPGTQAWSFATGDEVLAEVTAADGFVYAGSTNFNVYALDAATGAMRWSYRADNAIRSGPVVAHGIVYTSDEGGVTYANNARTGDLVWHFSTGGGVLFDPVVADGIVFTGGNVDSGPGTVYALDARTGTVRRTFNGSGNGLVGPGAVAGNVLYSVDGLGTLVAIDIRDGTTIWRRANTSVLSPFAVTHGTVYLASGNQVYAFDAATGRVRWVHDTGSLTETAPVAAGRRIYVGSGDALQALSADHGSLTWRFAVKVAEDSRPAVANGVVYLGGNDFLYALNANTGRQVWRYAAIFGGVGNGVSVAGGMVYFGAGDGSVHALRVLRG